MKMVAALFIYVVITGTAAGQPQLFQQYPATMFHEKPAHPRLRTPLAKEHATVIRDTALRGPNFAGHYTVVTWGCGSSCGVYVIVDERTGEIFEPMEIARGVDLGVAGPEFRPDSTLMIVANCPPPQIYGLKNCAKKFYKWDGSRLILLKTAPVRVQQPH